MMIASSGNPDDSLSADSKQFRGLRCSPGHGGNVMSDLESRVADLERRLRRLQVGLAAVIAMTLGGLVIAGPAAQAPDSPLRVRGLIIEDSSGRARVVLGAPIPGDGRTTNLRTGMRINDAAGVERFGLSLFDDDRVVMGFDAPPGKGDDRNRERISIVADQAGGGSIRFHDRRTLVPAQLYLDDQNRVWMEFSDSSQKPPVTRRLGLSGDETVRSQ
jgi:pimeloyl-ACP methyl ester carboxylesterase